MKPLLTSAQGQVVRALVTALARERKESLMIEGFVLQSIVSQPWASLTFAGERHRLIGHLPPAWPPAALDVEAMFAPAVAVTKELAWHRDAEATTLILELLILNPC